MYKSIKEKPKDRQLCLCKCPDWNEEGYQVAEYNYLGDDKFGYSGQQNDMFHDLVIAWMPLDRWSGEPDYSDYEDIDD